MRCHGVWTLNNYLYLYLCHDLKVISSNPGLVKLEVHSTSVLIRTLTKNLHIFPSMWMLQKGLWVQLHVLNFHISTLTLFTESISWQLTLKCHINIPISMTAICSNTAGIIIRHKNALKYPRCNNVMGRLVEVVLKRCVSADWDKGVVRTNAKGTTTVEPVIRDRSRDWKIVVS